MSLPYNFPANLTNTSISPFSWLNLTLSSSGFLPTTSSNSLRRPLRHALRHQKDSFENTGFGGTTEYWTISTDNSTSQRVEMVVFVDKVFPSVLEVFTSKGCVFQLFFKFLFIILFIILAYWNILH